MLNATNPYSRNAANKQPPITWDNYTPVPLGKPRGKIAGEGTMYGPLPPGVGGRLPVSGSGPGYGTPIDEVRDVSMLVPGQQPQAAPPAWQPKPVNSAQQNVDVVGLMNALGAGGGGGGGGGQWTHNPQPHTFGGLGEYYLKMGSQGPSSWSQAELNQLANSNIPVHLRSPEQQQMLASMGGGGGGGSMSPMSALAKAYQDAQNSAVKANEDRYQNILEGYQDRYNRAMQRLEGVGNQQRTDLNEQYNNQADSMRQNLVARGMSNSTVRDTMEMGNERERAGARNRLEDSLTRERLGYDTGLQSDLLQFMERRNDTYPDLNQMIQLAQMMGAGGIGYGGGGGGGGGMNQIPMGQPQQQGGGINPAMLMAMLAGQQGGGGKRPLNPFQQQAALQNAMNAMFGGAGGGPSRPSLVGGNTATQGGVMGVATGGAYGSAPFGMNPYAGQPAPYIPGPPGYSSGNDYVSSVLNQGIADLYNTF